METAQNVATVPGEGRVAWGWLVPAGLLAAIVAAVANALVYFVALGLGFVPPGFLIRMTSGEIPLTVGLVAITSVVGAVGAAVVFAVIGLFARRPVRLFRIVAAVALVLSFAMPLTIPGAPVAVVLSLEAMHVVAWAVIVRILTRWASKRARA
jgi:hypothetical protein